MGLQTRGNYPESTGFHLPATSRFITIRGIYESLVRLNDIASSPAGPHHAAQFRSRWPNRKAAMICSGTPTAGRRED